MRKYWPALLLLIPLICLTIFAFALIENNRNLLPLLVNATPHCETCFNYGPGGGIPPAGGACSNVGVDYPDDPFSGWPVDFWPGDWNIVSAWYCDPEYYLDFHVNHWGIDLARLDWSKDPTHAIYLATPWITTERAIVRQAIYCDPACYNWGMGNFVQVEALKYEKQCEINPASHAQECYWAWVPSGWIATYMHLHDITVSKGQILKRWAVIGHVDSTGNSTGDHLHYQINDPSHHAVDPAPTMNSDYTNQLRKEWKGKR